MRLTEHDVAEFQRLWREEFGVEITPERARAEGVKLLGLMSLVLQPPTDEELDAARERRRALAPLIRERITNEH